MAAKNRKNEAFDMERIDTKPFLVDLASTFEDDILGAFAKEPSFEFLDYSDSVAHMDRVADTLAKMGRTKALTWKELNNPPSEIWQALEDDILGHCEEPLLRFWGYLI
nr:hypothetical protein DM860_007437 [Ipomoea batatas]